MKKVIFMAIMFCTLSGTAQNTITALSPGDRMVGQTMIVRFTTDFAPHSSIPSGYGSSLTSYFQVELSDANGTFGPNPTIISQNAMVRKRSTPNGPESMVPIIGSACRETNLTSAGTYSVNAKLPNNIAPGLCYKIRVVCKQEYLVWGEAAGTVYGPNATMNTPARTSNASSCFKIVPVANFSAEPAIRTGRG